MMFIIGMEKQIGVNCIYFVLKCTGNCVKGFGIKFY